MNPENPRKKPEFQTATLEQHPNFTLATGVSLPIGASFQLPGIETSLELPGVEQ
jgi:hypothetical protein